MRSKEEVRQQMFAMIEQWHQSGLSQKAWCRQAGMSYHVFHYWYKCYRSTNKAPLSAAFTELKIQPGVFSFIELFLPDGKRVLFHQPVSSDYLKTIIN